MNLTGLQRDDWRSNRDQPPNLDDMINDFFNNLFGRNKRGSSSDSFSWLVLVVGVVIIGLWAVGGFYVIRPAEEAVVLRFGKFNTVVGPGLHWMALGIDSRYVVNTSKVEPYEYSSRMLTEDENYTQASLFVSYRIVDARRYYFNVVNPVAVMEKVVASSLRQVVGHTTLEGLLTTAKESVRGDVESLIKSTLDQYDSGLEISDVKLQEITVPAEVTPYFDDVIVAREEKAKKISEGERYVREIIPRARGSAERLIRSAHAYKEKIVLDAKASVAQYMAVLPKYQASPKLTEKRMFFEAMQQILGRVNKVYVDDSKQILYLPLSEAKKPSMLPNTLSEVAR